MRGESPFIAARAGRACAGVVIAGRERAGGRERTAPPPPGAPDGPQSLFVAVEVVDSEDFAGFDSLSAFFFSEDPSPDSFCSRARLRVP